MSILADIERLETQVQEILAAAGEPLRRTDAAQLLTDAILAAIDRLDLAEVAEADLARTVREALATVFPQLTQSLQQDVSQRVQQMIKQAADFYAERDVNVDGIREAVQRSEMAATISSHFEQGMRHIRTELGRSTTEVMQDAILSGNISRAAIEADILERAGTSERHAITQAQIAISAYNQVFRNELAERAELGHYLYFGTLQANSRHFCRVCIGKVFTRRQLEQMDNGMINPVLVYKGGWRCRHQLLPVDPSWDEELSAAVVTDEPTKVQVDAAGRRHITIAAPPLEVKRLETQIPMARRGYVLFENASTSQTGFVAVHQDWWARYQLGDRRTREWKTMERIRNTARSAAEDGQRVELVVDEEGYIDIIIKSTGS